MARKVIQSVYKKLWNLPRWFHQALWVTTGTVIVSVTNDDKCKNHSHFLIANRFPFVNCNYGLAKQLFPSCENE